MLLDAIVAFVFEAEVAVVVPVREVLLLLALSADEPIFISGRVDIAIVRMTVILLKDHRMSSATLVFEHFILLFFLLLLLLLFFFSDQSFLFIVPNVLVVYIIDQKDRDYLNGDN